MFFEPLESRDLLTVTTGLIDNDAYTQLRAQYPDFELPELQSDLNVMTITPDDGVLTLSDLKFAITTAGTTTLPDLILVQTSADANSVTYASAEDELSINIDSTQYGSVTIIGWGEEKFTIDANQQSRVMSVTGSNTVVNLGGLTVQNGKADNGGGIYQNYGTLTITNSEILGNTSTRYGGGIYQNYGTLTITDCEISSNTAKNGGGIYKDRGTLSIDYSVISENMSTEIDNYTYEYGHWGGGGIYNMGTMIITNSIITDNTSYAAGSGIYNNGYWYSANATITNSIISGNKVKNTRYSGGGIYNYGNLTIVSSEITGNSASSGGGIYSSSGHVTINNSLISKNTGGGIYTISFLTVKNSTISGNAANGTDKSGGIYRAVSSQTSINNSIVSMNYPNNISGKSTYDISANNIIDYIPGFVCAPVFDSNGLLTNSDTIDLHLRSDSSAIDKGDNSKIAGIESDIEGNNRVHGEVVDIGAYEYQGDRNDEPIPYSTVVNTLNDSFDLNDDEWSLREAIYYAPEYVTITFADELFADEPQGTIVLTQGQLNIDKALAINGNNRVTIDADQQSRVFFVCAGTEESPVVLDGLTIQNGQSTQGGGIYQNSGTTLTITNCTISGNTASGSSNSYGGGIYAYSGTLTITDSEISGNTASSSGGGIYQLSGTLTITDSEISGNTATSSGGGIYASSRTLTITNSGISGNTTSSSSNSNPYGGGIYASSGTTLMITNSEISGNTASGSSNSYGGGIYAYSGTLTITNCKISGNTASGSSNSYGGGIYQNSGTTLTITNCTISGNTASGSTNSYGGGIYNRNTLTITNCTISGNTASGSSNSYGGGIYQNSGTLNVYNSIVSLNYSDNLFGKQPNNTAYNLFNYNPGFVCAPIFGADGALTNADTMDLHLRSDSIAIDKGNNTTAADIETDLDGNVRIYGDAVDLGVYEYQGDRNDEPIYSSVVNTLNDSFDLTDDEWSLREAIFYATEYVTITFADELFADEPQGTIVLTQGQLNIDKALAINGNNRIIIDADQQSRVFSVSAGTDSAPVILEGLKIQNGKAANGGGIYISSYSSLTVTSCEILANAATDSSSSYGGGIYVSEYSTLTITNCEISENSASGNSSSSGGGIYINQGNLTITNCEISGNTVSGNSYTSGGGIYQKNGTLKITNSSITNNTSIGNYSDSYGGGGIWCSGTNVAIANSTISGNTATLFGSGINNQGKLTITNSTISDNTSYYGAGIYNTSSLTITNCMISDNTASNSGGGIYNKSSLTITNCVITGNTASNYGAGIYNTSSLTITNCTIAGNSADTDRYSRGGGIVSSGTTKIYNSIVVDNTAPNDADISSGTMNGYNCLSSYTGWGLDNNYEYEPNIPLFYNAENRDYRLTPFSQAIDMGNNEYAYNAGMDETSTDMLGVPRFIGNHIDLGAYESSDFKISQKGVYTDNVHFGWTQYNNAANVRLIWVSGTKKTLLGTFESSGEYTWDTTAFDNGYGQLTAEFLDENGSSVLTSTITGLILNDDNVVIHRGDITESETWSADKVHLVAGRVNVKNADLTIENSAVVKFWKNSYLYAYSGASLTVQDNVILTRLEDDKVAGDTNIDGNLSVPQYGNDYIRGKGTIIVSQSVIKKYVTKTTSGAISSDEIWFSGQVYHVTGNVTVADGATLTIMPGAIVKFDKDCSLIVEAGGTLIAEGTSSQPIVFTSVKDDQYGGDTNEDDGFYTPNTGDWGQILNSGGNIYFDYAIIRFCGKKIDWVHVFEYYEDISAAMEVTNGGYIQFNNSVVSSTFKAIEVFYGVFVAYNSIFEDTETALSLNSESTIVNCTITNALRAFGPRVQMNTLLADTTAFPCGGTIINSIFYNIKNSFGEADSFQNCVFYNPKGSGPQSFSYVGSNGNFWDDPMFRNAAAGDYHLMAGSPCIDAGSSEDAPETDITGAPRYDDPYTDNYNESFVDIGAYEFVDGASSSIDLEPVNVQAPDSVSTGDKVTIQWTIQNNGSVAATGAWTDGIYLVNEYTGQSVLVKDYAHASAISAGDLQTFYAEIVIPNVADGFWKVQIQVNANREIFEGAYNDNNVSLSNSMDVSCPVWTLGTTTIQLNAPILRKIVQKANEPLLIQAQSSGASVIQISIDGGLTYQTAEADCNGMYTLYAPADQNIRTVYVKAESSDNSVVQFNISNEQYALSGVSNHSVVQGNATIQIYGGGFESGMKLSLRSGETIIEAHSIYLQSSSNAAASFDLSEAAVGLYDLVMEVNGQTRTLANAVEASAILIGAKLEYDFPFPNSLRTGRTYLCHVYYQNVGDCDMNVPILHIDPLTGAVGISPDDVSYHDLYLIDAGTTGTAGVLRAGEQRCVTFYYTAVSGTNSVSIGYENIDKELSAAITRWDLRGNDVNHIGSIKAFAEALQHGDDVACVSGFLRDVDSKEPISGARIQASWVNADGETETDFVYTNDSGRYVFNYLPEDVDVTLSVFSGADAHTPVVVHTAAEDIADYEILANRYYSISGKVVGVDGAMKKDVVVIAENADGELRSACTDKYGSFTFDNLEKGTWSISVSTTGRFKATDPVDAELLYGKNIVGLKLLVDAGAGLRGTVTNSSGEPIENALVSVTDSQGVSFNLLTGADGAYLFSGFNEGEATITVTTDDYVKVIQSVELAVGITTLDVQCVSGLTVSGVVENPDGSMFKSGFVALVGESGGYYSGTIDNGEFSFNCLPAGEYSVIVMNSSNVILYASELTLNPGENVSDLSIRLGNHGILTGTAQASGKNVSGLRLALYQNGELVDSATTKFDGGYSFAYVETGEYELVGVDTDYSWRVVVDDQHLAVNQNLELDFCVCVTGNVTLPEGVASAEVQIYYYDEQAEDYFLVDSAYTNSDGAIRFWLDQPGRYRFNASCTEGIYTPQEVVIDASDSEASFSLNALGAGNAVILFNGLVPSEGEQVFYTLNRLSESVWIGDQEIEGYSLETLCDYTDDLSGLTFTNLQPGKYTLSASYGSFTANAEFTLTAENSAVDIALDFTESIAFTVTTTYSDDADVKLENAVGYLYDSSNNLVSIEYADENGQFQFENVSDGEYTIIVFNGEYIGKATVSIVGNESAEIVMTEAPVIIRGAITLDGAAVSEAKISVMNEDGLIVGLGVVGQDGSFVVYCLESESYYLEVHTETSGIYTTLLENGSDSEINAGVIALTSEPAAANSVQIVFVDLIDQIVPEAQEGFGDIVYKLTGIDLTGITVNAMYGSELQDYRNRIQDAQSRINTYLSNVPSICPCECTDMNAMDSFYKDIDNFNQTLESSNSNLSKLEGELADFVPAFGNAITSCAGLAAELTALLTGGAPILTAISAITSGIGIAGSLDDLSSIFTDVMSGLKSASDELISFCQSLYDYARNGGSLRTLSIDNKIQSLQSKTDRIFDRMDGIDKTNGDAISQANKSVKDMQGQAQKLSRNIQDNENILKYDKTLTAAERQAIQADIANCKNEIKNLNSRIDHTKSRIAKYQNNTQLIKKAKSNIAPFKSALAVLNVYGTCQDVVDAVSKYNQKEQTIKNINNALNNVNSINPAIGKVCTCSPCKCNEKPKPFPPPGNPKNGNIVISIDPNELFGPVGGDFVTHDEGTEDEPFLVIDGANWVTNNAGQENTYTIYFENKTTASAAAQEVFVTTVLPAGMDWDSMELGAISIGNEIYALSDDCLITENTWLVNQASTGEQIKIRFDFDAQTGEANWYLRSYVSTTYDNFPTNAYDGFLPPNDKETHVGEGYVSYRVKYNSDLVTGSVVSTNATIVFDTNEPIVTNTWLNTIDIDVPEVQLDEPEVIDEGVLLHWSGSDVGSGIDQYQIFISFDDSAYKLWNTFDADVTSAIFSFSAGGEYSFYILAVDAAGNVAGDPEQATPPILVISKLDARIVKDRNDHVSTDEISENLASITDWDDFYMEFWTPELTASEAGKTFTATINYDSSIFLVDADQVIATPNGVTAEIVDMGSIAGVGLSTVQVTFTVGEDGYTAPGANAYWGAVHFTPNLAKDSGVQNVLEPTELNVTANGKESGTTVTAMPFDLDHNNVVDVNDFIAFATVYGKSPDSVDPSDPNYAQTCLSDFDGSGVIDVQDFIAFATNFGIKKGSAVNYYNAPKQNSAAAQPSAAVVNEDELIVDNSSDQPTQPDVATQTLEVVEVVATIQEPSPEYLPQVQPAQAASVQTLRQAHSSALLDLYDNQNASPSVCELSASAIDETLYQDNEFDFLFDESDLDADDSSDSSVDLSVVLDELELEFA